MWRQCAQFCGCGRHDWQFWARCAQLLRGLSPSWWPWARVVCQPVINAATGRDELPHAPQPIQLNDGVVSRLLNERSHRQAVDRSARRGLRLCASAVQPAEDRGRGLADSGGYVEQFREFAVFRERTLIRVTIAFRCLVEKISKVVVETHGDPT